MNYYDEELQRLQQEIMEKERADAKLADLYIQQNELEKNVEDLKKIMEEEQEDVDRLKRRGITALFYRAAGKMEEKLSKEEEEAFRAVVKYEAAKNELQAVGEDIAFYVKQTADLPKCKKQYETVMEKKKEEIKKSGNPEAEKIMEIERRMAFLKNQNREIHEALDAGQQALYRAEEISQGLKDAKTWGTIDLMGGGLMTDVIKYDKLNKVRDKTMDLQSALRSFRTELADVSSQIDGDIQVEIGDFLHFADYFFDGFITDWMVYDRIKQAKERAERTCSQIQGILERLHQIQENLRMETEQKNRELEQFVLTYKE
nr:hypothetical protein [uncultured Sellimonas sp.]